MSERQILTGYSSVVRARRTESLYAVVDSTARATFQEFRRAFNLERLKSYSAHVPEELVPLKSGTAHESLY
jgi:hypothetical protein